jgi:hypothetical protein
VTQVIAPSLRSNQGATSHNTLNAASIPLRVSQTVIALFIPYCITHRDILESGAATAAGSLRASSQNAWR